MPMPSKPDNRNTSLTVRKSTRDTLLKMTHPLIPADRVVTWDERLMLLIEAYEAVRK